MKIAIIIPTYNAYKTIAETLVSVQKNIQLNHQLTIKTIIADDCSRDNTLDIVQNTWYLSPELIEILRSQLNQGERANVNHAIEKIINEFDWIYILHSDDIAKENWLKVLYEQTLIYPDVAAISTSYDVLYEDGKTDKGENHEHTSLIKSSKEAIKNTLKNGTWFHISGCAISTSTIKKIGYFQKDLPQYGDMEYVLRILYNQLDILYIPQSLTIYRQISTSVSSNSFKINLDILESSSLVAHFKEYFNESELKLQNERFQTYLNKRIARSIATLNIKRLLNAVKLKGYVKDILLKNRANKYQFPFLNIQNG